MLWPGESVDGEARVGLCPKTDSLTLVEEEYPAKPRSRYVFAYALLILAQVSRSDTVRLNTNRSPEESTESTQK